MQDAVRLFRGSLEVCFGEVEAFFDVVLQEPAFLRRECIIDFL